MDTDTDLLKRAYDDGAYACRTGRKMFSGNPFGQHDAGYGPWIKGYMDEDAKMSERIRG